MPVKNESEKNPDPHIAEWDRDKHEISTISGISTLVHTYRNEQKANRAQEDRENQSKKWREIWTLFFVILTTGGIFYQACILHSSDVAIQKSANAAKDAADAAKVNADILLGAQRAQMFVKELTTIGVIDPTSNNLNQWGISPKWQNFGVSPALDVEAFTIGKIIALNEPDPTIFDYEMPKQQRGTTVGPSVTVTGMAATISVADAIRLWKKEIKFYVYARMQYRDIFNAAKVHVTEQCAELIIDEKPPIIGFQGTEFRNFSQFRSTWGRAN